MAELPKFDAPPVVEVALSLQFAELPGLTAAHCGWYWREHLGEGWNQVRQVNPLDDVFEKFGDEKEWKKEGIQISQALNELRLQFISSDDERVIQVQKSRFVYNWRKRSTEYPSFDRLMPEFESRFEDFGEFVRKSGSGELTLNQWELNYVDHIEKGTLWESAKEWKNISPALAAPVNVEGQEFETLSSEWHFGLEGNKGRLRVLVKHARTERSGPEILFVQFLARGPVDEERSFRDGFRIGHEHSVNTFARMTSDVAHRYWKRSR